MSQSLKHFVTDSRYYVGCAKEVSGTEFFCWIPVQYFFFSRPQYAAYLTSRALKIIISCNQDQTQTIT